LEEKNSLLQSISTPEKQLVFIGGKGGVGKTTIATSIGLSLAKQFKTLLISTDPAHSLCDSLEIQNSSGDPVTVSNSEMQAWQIDSSAAFSAFKEKHEDEIRLLLDTGTYLDNEDIDQMLELMLPGVDEVMGLKSIIDVLETQKYEKVIVDTAPTGHTLRLLLIPEILDAWIKTMASMRWKYRTIQTTFKGKYTPDDADDMLLELKRLVSKMKKILSDKTKCEFILVSQLTSMALSETARLHEQLTSHSIYSGQLIYNQTLKASIDPFYQGLFEQQQALKKKTNFKNLNITEIPIISGHPEGRKRLSEIERHLN